MKKAVVLTACFLFCMSAAMGAPLLVSNFSFETLPAGGLTNSCGTGCTFSTVAIPNWASTGTVSGQAQFSAAQFNTFPNGPTVAYSNGGTISQTVSALGGATIAAADVGQVLTLDVSVGLRKDIATGPLGTAQLLIGTTPINATGSAPTAGNWSTFAAIYTITAADVGKSLTIQLTAPGVQGNFDNVLLTEAAVGVPEPATIALLGFGLVGLGLLKRRGKRA